jgi:DNA-binding GntR family transcriptional regulator
MTKPQRRGNAGEYAVEQIRAAILEGRFGPAERISQDQIAEELSLSRSPVREALRQLNREGLVRITPNAGAEVVTLDPIAVVDIYRLREKLDPIALADGIDRISDETIRRLGEYCDEMESLPESESKRFEELDRRFHSEAREGTRLPQFRVLLDDLWNMSVLGRNQFWSMGSSHEITNMEHRLILEAIQRRDGEDAAQFLATHIRRTRAAISATALKVRGGDSSDATGRPPAAPKATPAPVARTPRR